MIWIVNCRIASTPNSYQCFIPLLVTLPRCMLGTYMESVIF